MTRYVGILDGSGDVWGVRVPDLPGCVGGGPSPEMAIDSAVAAMSWWVSTVLAKGGSVPQARNVETILSDPDAEFNAQAGESVVMLPLLYEAGRPVKANISIDAAVLAAIDQAADVRGMTRSGFIAAAARAMIERDAV